MNNLTSINLNHPIQISHELERTNDFPIDVIEKIITLGKLNIETIKSLRLVDRTWRVGANLAVRNLTVTHFNFLEKVAKFAGLQRVTCRKKSRMICIRGSSILSHLMSRINNVNAPDYFKYFKLSIFLKLITTRQIECFLDELKKIYYWLTSDFNRAFAKLDLLPHLQAVHLEGMAELTDSGLNVLGQLTRITELKIVDCPNISIQGLQRLLKIQHLRTLSLGLPVTDPLSVREDITDARSIWKLKHVDHYLLRQIKLLTSDNLSKIKALKLMGILRSNSIMQIANLPALHELTLAGALNSDSLNAVSLLTNLESIRLNLNLRPVAVRRGNRRPSLLII